MKTAKTKTPKLPSMYDPKQELRVCMCSRCGLPREIYKRGACGPCFAVMNLFSAGLGR